MKARTGFLKHLWKESKVFQRKNLLKAFEAVDRADFVPEDYKAEAYEDYPLPIGFGQTISQPTTVAFMLELLDVEEGDNVLDVGSGSGWTTALLSSLAGASGSVVGVEIIPELVTRGQENLAPYGPSNVKIVPAEAEIGFAKQGPYDRILVSAAAENEVPEKLLLQLKLGGTLVMPVGDTIVQVKKISEDDFETKEFPGFRFVELKY